VIHRVQVCRQAWGGSGTAVPAEEIFRISWSDLVHAFERLIKQSGALNCTACSDGLSSAASGSGAAGREPWARPGSCRGRRCKAPESSHRDPAAALRDPARSGSIRLDCGRPLCAAQLLRRTCAALRNSLDNTIRAPLRSTRGPIISIVPEMPFCELVETMLSDEAMNSPALIVMLPPWPSIACAMMLLWSSTTVCGSIVMLPPLPVSPLTEVVISLFFRASCGGRPVPRRRRRRWSRGSCRRGR